MNKIVEALRGKYLTDLGCNALLNGDHIEVHLPQLEQIAAILQASGPAGFQVRNSYSKNKWTGCHGFATTEEAEQCGSEWRYVYTAPPEVAELERQLAKSEALNLAINNQLMAAIDDKAQLVIQLAQEKLSRFDEGCLEAGQQIQRAAAELPDGYEIGISIEKDAGTIRLFDSFSNEIELVSDHDGIASDIKEAIETAKEHATGQVNP